MFDLTQKSDKLTADDIDDLIYACRTNSLVELQQCIPEWAGQLNTAEADIISKAIDVDDEGLGSRACLLHYPAANGNLEMIQWLLEKLSFQPQATGGSTQVNGDSGTEPVPTNSAVPSQLLVNHQNVSGNTPLHWAALNGHIEIVKALVKAGADPTIVNEAGRDAVVEAEYSAQAGADECATWLLKECEALERGAGGVQAGEGEPSTEEQGQEGMEVDGVGKEEDAKAES